MGRILLAEDNEANITLFTSILDKIGLEIDVAKTGTQAVQYATQNIYDLILMDIGLPEFDGLDATSHIRSAGAPYSNATIYALTADDDKTMKDACEDVGMNGFLVKPISPITLMKTVQKIISSGPSQRDAC